jgi:hypothetical protein
VARFPTRYLSAVSGPVCERCAIRRRLERPSLIIYAITCCRARVERLRGAAHHRTARKDAARRK